MTRRFFILLVALLLAVGLTAGCGTSGPRTDPPTDTPPTTFGFYAWSPEQGPRLLDPFGEGHGNSIQSTADKHFPGVRYHTHFVPAEVSGNWVNTIMFKWLTDQLLFILTDAPDSIQEHVATFDREAFLTSWQLEHELWSAMNYRGPVLDVEILTGLGAPSRQTSYTTGTTTYRTWHYDRYRITLYLTQGVLTSFMTY